MDKHVTLEDVNDLMEECIQSVAYVLSRNIGGFTDMWDKIQDEIEIEFADNASRFYYSIVGETAITPHLSL